MTDDEARLKMREYLAEARRCLGVTDAMVAVIRNTADAHAPSLLDLGHLHKPPPGSDKYKELSALHVILCSVFGDDYVLRPRSAPPADPDRCPFCSQADVTPVFSREAGGDVVVDYTCYHPRCERKWTDRFTFAGRTLHEDA